MMRQNDALDIYKIYNLLLKRKCIIVVFLFYFYNKKALLWNNEMLSRIL